jgi:LysR family transcriptional regulator for metE and metH
MAEPRSDAIETRHLRLLVALEEEKTLHGAARRLHLTASALSQQLRELEARLGNPLFHRRWRRLTPTGAARALTNGGRLVLRELERLEQETRGLLTGNRGTVRFATTCAQSFTWLPRVWRVFAARHPEIEVSLAHADTEVVRSGLLERRLDLALVAGSFPEERELDVQRILHDELMLVVAARHPWAKRRTLELGALDGAHLLTDRAALEHDAPLGRALAAEGARPRVSHVPTNGTAVLELVRAGVGVGVMPRWLAGRTRGVRLVRLGRRGLWLDWSIASPAEPLTPPVETLAACIRESVAGF